MWSQAYATSLRSVGFTVSRCWYVVCLIPWIRRQEETETHLCDIVNIHNGWTFLVTDQALKAALIIIHVTTVSFQGHKQSQGCRSLVDFSKVTTAVFWLSILLKIIPGYPQNSCQITILTNSREIKYKYLLWYGTLGSPALRWLKLGDCKLRTSLGYTVSSRLCCLESNTLLQISH